MNGAFFSSSRAKFSANSVNHRGWAWMSLCLALAAHVFDEAMTDFFIGLQPDGSGDPPEVPVLSDAGLHF
jgi:hypothetical protein